MFTLEKMDYEALKWLRTRCGQWRFQVKRYRKYHAVPGSDFSPEELDALNALTDIEYAVGKLLKTQGNRK